MSKMRVVAGLSIMALMAGPLAAQDMPGPEPGPDLPSDLTGEAQGPPPPGGAVVRIDGDEADQRQFPMSSVLTVNDAALFAGSAWGRRVQADLEALSHEIAAENDRIFDDLSAEEDALTELRATMPPAEFRELAEDFDSRAQAIRAERQAALHELSDRAEAERQGFFSAVVPILAEVMAERGALVILDQRTVFVSADIIDVTETLIERIDAEVGAGPAPAQNPTQAEPDAGPNPGGNGAGAGP